MSKRLRVLLEAVRTPNAFLLATFILCGAAVCAFPAEISGTLSVLGCDADLPHLTVQAHAVTGPTAGSAETIVAKLASMSDGPITFSFNNARDATVYRLSANLTTPKCGKVFWRAPNTGLVYL